MLSIAQTLLHEGQHALFDKHLIDLGLSDNSISSKIQAWQDYSSLNFDITYNTQHQAMVDEYIDKAARFLWNLNGMQGSLAHYKYCVYEGLPSYLFDGRMDEVALWEGLYNELNDPQNGFNIFSCN